MPWWAWLIFGVMLLGVEMFVIDAQFYLVFLGVSATVVGLVGLAGIEAPVWSQWLAFAILSLATMFGFRKRIYELVRSRSGHVQQRVTSGDKVVVPLRLEPGHECRVEYRGSSWTARNVDRQPIDSGAEAEIVTIQELTLLIRPTPAA